MGLLPFTKTILRGISQVMLQKNALTGLLFLLGILYNSPVMALAALAGTMASTIAASALKYNEKEINDGLYGFNGALVGIALLVFFEFSIALFAIIIIASVLSALIMNDMRKKNLKPYTFPFVLTTWLFLIFNPQKTNLLAQQLNISSAITMGFAQVMFQASIVTGIIFMVALALNSPKPAIFAFIGSFVGMAVAIAFSFPASLISSGMFGFNAVLCGIALADKKLFYPVFGIIISVFMTHIMLRLNIVPLTAPFVFATWITLAIKQKSSPVISHQLP